VLFLLLNYVEWTNWITFCAFAYFVLVFVIFQILYNVGAKKHAVKIATGLKK